MLITLGLFILFPVAGWTPVLLFWIFDLDCACTAETSPAARKVFRGLMLLLGVLAASMFCTGSPVSSENGAWKKGARR